MPLYPVLIFFSAVELLYKIGVVGETCEASNALGASPTVKLTSGAVQGLSCVSALGLPYLSYRGIPYAAPPLGDLRFKPPRPPSKWQGVLQATTEPPACSQARRKIAFPITYSEDCLFINVFTPNLRPPSGGELPVIFWVFGGNYSHGNAATYKYGPDFFLEKGVILVSINYRVGVFGFLNMNISDAQGNAGLKDMVEALKWVRREIHNFGGDPNLVTIFGGSSGAIAVNMLYLSSMAKGLFSRAISHSSTAYRPGEFKDSNLEFGQQLGYEVGCNTSSPQDTVACLRQVNAEELAEKQLQIKGFEQQETLFIPTVETFNGEEVFLPADPTTLFDKAPNIPYILGLNSGEGLAFIDNPEENPDEFTDFNQKITSNLPPLAYEIANPKVFEDAAIKIEEFYFKNISTLENTIYSFVDYMRDREVGYPVVKAAQQLSLRAPVYLYYFRFLGDFRPRHHYMDLNISLSGVCHGDELGYFFYRNYTVLAHNDLLHHQRDLAMVGKLTTIWTHFATFGKPTPFTDLWQPVKGKQGHYLSINDDFKMINSPLFEDRVEFWDDLYSFISLNNLSFSSNEKFTTPPYLVTIPFFIVFIALFIVTFKYSNRHGYVSLK